MNHGDLFRLVEAVEGNVLITGVPGTGKTSLVKWSLRHIPSDYAVVVYDTVGNYKGFCDHYYQYNVNINELPVRKAIKIIKESLTAKYGDSSRWTPDMERLFTRAVEEGARTLKDAIDMMLKVAEEHEVGTAKEAGFILARFMSQFGPTNLPLKPGHSTCVDISAFDWAEMAAYVLTHLELTHNLKNIIYVIDDADPFRNIARPPSLLTYHLFTGHTNRRFFVLTSHLFEEFAQYLDDYIKVIIRFTDWDLAETEMMSLKPSEALVTIKVDSVASVNALRKLGVAMSGTRAQFRLYVPPYSPQTAA